MESIKLIAIDLDDTLLDGKLQVSPRAAKAIREARDLGVQVTIATGRMYRSALPYAKELGIDVPLITYQGALVKNSLSGEVLVNKPVPLELAREVISIAQKQGYHINVYIKDELYVNKVTEEGLYYSRIAGVPLNPVGDLLDFLIEEPTKLLIVTEEEKVQALKIDLVSRFKEHLHITTSKPNFLEILNSEATKASALSYLAEGLGISQRETMAIGDSYNDLEMLEFAGFGVVMGNAKEEIKKVANFVGPSNEEDGVAKVIEKFVIKRGEN